MRSKSSTLLSALINCCPFSDEHMGVIKDALGPRITGAHDGYKFRPIFSQ
jgi:hypothetical protein